MFDKFEDYQLEFHGVRLPEIKIDIKDKEKIGLSKNASNYEYLSALCYQGFENKVKKGEINPKDAQIYTDRCKYELEVFKKNNIVDYILLIYDILDWCDKNDIARGVSRGSASGSCVFYLIGCNKINPVRHGLPFTRFLNEARIKSKTVNGILYLNGPSLCDYDADVSYINRQRVLNYISERFKGRVSRIGSLLTLTGKIAIKECSKTVLGYNEDEALVLSHMIEKHYGKVEKLSESIKNNEDLQKWVESNPRNKKCFDLACSIESTIKAKSQHPSGVAISYDQIDESLPLELSADKEPITAYDMEDIANLVIKGDILGLKNADINYNICKRLNIDSGAIDINHPSIYEFLKSTTNYFGLFQIESGLTKDTVVKVQPKNIDELSVCVSISRPATIKDISKYVEYIKTGKYDSIFPAIDEILKSCANILLYQEFVTEICVKVFGFSEIDADQIRYCTGKKKKEEMVKWKPQFFKNGKDRKIPDNVTEKMWNTIESSADYQFCKNHAYAYAYTTAINTYLKANYPKEFYLELLRMAKNEPDYTEKLSIIYNEMNEVELKLLPPHILYSKEDFEITKEGILFGLSAIRGVSEKNIIKLRAFQNEFSNKFQIFNAAKQAKLPINILIANLLVGALDDVIKPLSRSRVVLEAQIFNQLTDNERVWCFKLAEQYNYDLIEIIRALNEKIFNDKGKPIIRDTRRITIRNDIKKFIEMYDFNKKNESMAQFIMERFYIGFSYSTTLYNIYKDKVDNLQTLQEINGDLDDSRCKFVAEVVEAKQSTSKNGNPYLKLMVKDHTSSSKVMIFGGKSNKLDQCKEMNGGKYPGEGAIIIVEGTKKDGNCIFADKITSQDIQIFLKISQLPKDKHETV